MIFSKRRLNITIFLAVVLRLILGSFLFHPDLKSQYFHGQFLSRGIADIYGYLDYNRHSLGYSDTFNYPPLAYFYFGSWFKIASVYTGDSLPAWINDWSGEAMQRDGIFLNLLILKIPYFIADIIVLYFLKKLLTVNYSLLTVLWLFNPISLYVIYGVGQFDILPVLATVASLYLAKQGKFMASGLSLGLGIALKSYPVLLLPGLICYTPGLVNKLKTGILGLLPWIILTLFIPGSLSALQSGLVGRIFAAGLPITASVSLLFYPLGLIFALWYVKSRDIVSLTRFYLTSTLLVILFSQYHFQWTLWFLPFALITSLSSKTRLFSLLGLMLVLFVNLLFLPDQFAFINLMTPLNPYLSNIPNIPSLMAGIGLPVEFISSLVRSLLIVIGLHFIYITYAESE